MKIPFLVCDELEDEDIKLWKDVYAKTIGTETDKTVEESLWRRTQSAKNKKVSGWKNTNDKRRKVVYYRHKYALSTENCDNPCISLVSTYVYICLTLPKKEIAEYLSLIRNSLEKGGWNLLENLGNKIKKYRAGKMILEVSLYNKTEQHLFEYDKFPNEYQTLEIKVYSDNFIIDQQLLKKPWNVLRCGLRKKMKRNKPTYLDNPQDIFNFLPAQVELGCGPSYEAGVPPLHELHYRYSINEPLSKKFIIKAKDDLFLTELISNTSKKYLELADIFASILHAQSTIFYQVLKKLFQEKFLVGDIITNNFDGLHLRLGLKELYVRKYEESVIVPKINFHPDARSLIVVGSHADRRFIQESARKQGLKVIYIDPEGWWIKNKFFSYPLESPQKEDIIFKKTASKFFADFYKKLCC